MIARTAALFASLALAPPARAGEPPTVSLARLGAVEVGKPAPWFSAWSADNRPLNLTRLLKDGADRHALVFFATWCKPCRDGLAQLARAEARLREARVGVVLLAVEEDDDVVAAFAAEHKLGPSAVALDKFGEAARAYGVATTQDGRERVELPRTFVIDGKGVVVAILAAEGRDYVDRIIAGK